MPFKSEAQRRLLWAKRPAIARRWHEEYGTPKELPMHVAEGEGEKGKAVEPPKPASTKAASNGEGLPMSQLTFEEKIIDTLQVSAAALEKAEAADREKQAQAQQVAALVPEAVDACIRGGKFDEEDRTKLASALADPVKALKILCKVATHRSVEEANHLGSQVDQKGRAALNKQAAYGSVDSAYVGGRTHELKPSDLVLFKGLGLG